MKVVVQDASILIDLVLSQTVDAWFATGVETWTTNLIYPLEIDQPEQRAILGPYVSAKKLQIREISDLEVEEILALRGSFSRGLSLADLSALFLTRELGAGTKLATGDRALRNAATHARLDACGILGLFEVMVEAASGRLAVLPYPVAADRLRQLLKHPECRLPRGECEARIRAWASR